MNNMLSFVRKLVPSSSANKLHFIKLTCNRFYSNIVNDIEENSTYHPPSYVKLPPLTGVRKKQIFDYFLILDFEATCDAPKNVVPQEIIEFPVLKVNATTFETESTFHSYVRPVMNPELTSFCTRLTGITQEMVDKQPDFEDVYEDFQYWMHNENILKDGIKFSFITCGDWDLKYIFPIQCKGLRIHVPDYMKRWINIKYSFETLSSTYPKNMALMMKYSQLELEGQLHSGIDDCKNLARLVKNLADRGMLFELNAGGRC
ncbi:hypothetical protein JTE90_028495 [Oedothorax gibbosus]|uniref:Exonuclease domain-containing protein n=1 Tax=Oedothorax gibbosus TaxID=931172 RepID=A0AAV6VX11_9ARAC|nr:hypothetical protein JTE90_028495 [Oedothorax gibbosus]